MQSSRASFELREGTILDARYRLGRKLGEGSMGDVYEAQRLAENDRVAVKVLKPERALKEVLVERFLREARSAALIDHPHVVKVYDFGRVPDGPIYFAMEYLEGEDLSSVLKRSYRLPWARCKSLLLQLSSALAAAHACGIVHRDVKPSNCLLLQTESSEIVKLVDFGVAKLDEAMVNRTLTKAADVIGTALYMSPEQVEGRTVDARSDVYGLGVTAYELLTGQVPFRGHDIFKIMSRQLRTPPRPPRQLVPGLPQAVEDLLLRALAKDPSDRPQNMEEFEDALRDIPTDESLDDSPALDPYDLSFELALQHTEPAGASSSGLSALRSEGLAASLCLSESESGGLDRRGSASAEEDLEDGPTRAYMPEHGAKRPASMQSAGARAERAAPGGTLVAVGDGVPQAVVTGLTEVVRLDLPQRAPEGVPVRSGNTLVTTQAEVAGKPSRGAIAVQTMCAAGHRMRPHAHRALLQARRAYAATKTTIIARTRTRRDAAVFGLVVGALLIALLWLLS